MQNILEIGCEAGTNTTLLRWCVNTDEDEIGFPDALLNIGREEQVASSCLANNILKTWLVNR